MNSQQKLKAIGIFSLIILILNMIFFALGKIDLIVFWGIIILGAIFVWKGLPWLKENTLK